MLGILLPMGKTRIKDRLCSGEASGEVKEKISKPKITQPYYKCYNREQVQQ